MLGDRFGQAFGFLCDRLKVIGELDESGVDFVDGCRMDLDLLAVDCYSLLLLV